MTLKQMSSFLTRTWLNKFRDVWRLTKFRTIKRRKKKLVIKFKILMPINQTKMRSKNLRMPTILIETIKMMWRWTPKM